jgi:hypothetical protein
MSTPHTKKRYKPPTLNQSRPNGHYISGLANPEYAQAFAAIATEFEHLELNLSNVFAFLLGAEDEQAAGYVLRAMQSAQMRLDVMKALLHRAPFNATTEELYDHILAEYDEVRKLRNGYVHGLWDTNADTGEVYWTRRTEHGHWFLETKPEPLQNLIDAVDRIRALNITILISVRSQLAARRKQRAERPPPPPAPTPLTSASRSRRRHTAKESLAPPPPPSPASPRKRATKKAARKKKTRG